MAWETTLLADLRKVVQEAAAGYWTDAELTALLKEAESEFIARTGLYKGSFTAQNIVAATALYTKDSSCLQLENVMAAGDPLEEKNGSELIDWYGADWTTKTGSPWAFVDEGIQIRLVPIPDTSTTSGLVMWGTKRPDQTATVITPTRYHRYIVSCAASLAYGRDKANAEYRDYHMGEFLAGVDLCMKEKISKNKKKRVRSTTRSSLNTFWSNS